MPPLRGVELLTREHLRAAERQTPPTTSPFSTIVTSSCPFFSSSTATAMPPKPAPTTRTETTQPPAGVSRSAPGASPLLGQNDIARSACAVIVSDGFTPRLAVMALPSAMCRPAWP